MKITYLQELKKYSKSELECTYGISEKKMKKLQEYGGILKPSGDSFCFKYVGLIGDKDRIFAILPKYLPKFKEDSFSNESNFITTMKILEKYNNLIFQESLDAVENYNDITCLENVIPLISFLFKDYNKHGLYETTLDDHTINGNGEINWHKTIENEDAVFSQKKPLYLNLWTKINEIDEENYIRKLHVAILTSCLKRVEHLKILNILEIPMITFSSSININEDLEFNIEMIDLELKSQFDDRKIKLLKAIKLYLKKVYFASSDSVSLWGTTVFSDVWEKACKKVLRDAYEINKKYSQLIKKNTSPQWLDLGKVGNSMRADIVYEDNSFLYLLDAKYYLFEDNASISVEDISKQYIYMMALRDLKLDNGKKFEDESVTKINALISPGKKNYALSRIELPVFESTTPIYSILLDANEVFNLFIEGRQYPKNHIYNIIFEAHKNQFSHVEFEINLSKKIVIFSEKDNIESCKINTDETFTYKNKKFHLNEQLERELEYAFMKKFLQK